MEKITYDDDQLLEHVLNDKHMGVLINNGLQNISFNDLQRPLALRSLFSGPNSIDAGNDVRGRRA